jgi:polyisoprenoid-binding protein YceI
VVAFAYIYIRGGSGTPSATISAPTLAISLPTQAPATAAPTEAEAATETTDEVPAVSSAASEVVVFNIAPEQSNVTFTLTEELRGQPTTVVGETDQVAGQIAVDFGNPSASQVGEIRINARTLETDNDFRNRAIRGEILQSAQDQFEFISFVPTDITGLPDTITMGEPIIFQIVGDLTIRDITNPVTFEATVTPVSEAQLEGTAATTVQRGDYNLEIPSVSSVANVSEAVDLQIDFVAAAT